jgi:hypothetical protein
VADPGFSKGGGGNFVRGADFFWERGRERGRISRGRTMVRAATACGRRL